MITLYSFGPNFGLPDPSPFAMKTQVQLKMAGLTYASDHGGRAFAPKGKLPFIDDDGIVVADSAFIRDYVERTYVVDLDRGLDGRQRAQAWAIERMLEDHLYWVMVHARWAMDDNFAKGPAHFFDSLPAPAQGQARTAARESVLANLQGQGLGRHNVEDIAALGRKTLDSLAMMLGDQAYLFGDRPCGADATAFAFVACALCPLFISPMRDAAEGHANLIAYSARMMQCYYPKFATTEARTLVDA
jgi:glutathione S-transferase